MKEIVSFSVALFAFFCVLQVGCGASEAAKSAAADTAYATEQLRCVDKFDNRAEIDACRQGVRLKWGVAETVAKFNDAGAGQ